MSAAPGDVVAFRDLDVDRDLELLERFHRDVLAVSFSADELDDVGALARGLYGDGESTVLASVALGRDDVVLGGVVGEVYAQEHVLLLAYLAVRPELRGRGIGAALVEHAGQRWYPNPNVRLAVAEAHDPRRWSNLAGEHPRSRLRFYGRLGARVLGVPFVQPALRPGRARIRGFLLLAFHVDPSVEIQRDGESAVRSDIVGRFVRRYYQAAEGARPPYDTELADLLGLIEQDSSIPLLPIGEFDRVPLLTERSPRALS